MSETNKDVVRRMFSEIINQGRLELIDELFDPAYTSETPQGVLNRDEFRGFVQSWRNGFADIECTVSDLVAEGDAVAWRIRATGTHTGEFNGIPATGRRVSFDSLNIGHFRDGRGLTHVVIMDTTTMLAQLGVLPPELVAP
jgi:steroid delta-isomerase-like uncharacterized protein